MSYHDNETLTTALNCAPPFLAMNRKTTRPTTAMKSIPPTTGPTISAMSPVRRAALVTFGNNFVYVVTAGN